MTGIRVRLDDEDRQQFGGEDGPLPAALRFDPEALKDLTADELERLEMESGIALSALLANVVPRLSGLASIRRAVAWVALRQAGRQTGYDAFNPRLLRAEFVVEDDDADPPAGTSERSSEE